MRTVGVVGLGAMGLPMAETLVRAGFDVAGYDLSPARRDAFAASVGDLAALSERDAVLLSLPNDAVVRTAAAALLERMRPGALIVDCSTIAPETARALQTEAAGRRVGYVDAPVSGGAVGAAGGALLVMAGGDEADVARAAPLLDALARKVVRCGGPGAGAVAKLANNLLCAGHLLLAGEALRIAEAGGVAPNDLLEALNAGSGRSAATEVNLPRWVLSQAFDSAFSVGLMAKDVSLAERVDGAGPLAADVAARWRAAAAELGEQADFNRVVETGAPKRDQTA